MTRDEIQTKVIELYVGILGRAPDYAGLTYWTDSIEQGNLSLENARAAFATKDQPEYWNIYGGLSNTALVEKVYNNFLERSPDQAGLDYWVSELDSGKIQPDFMVNAIINAVQSSQTNSDQTLTDAQVLTNKVSASRYFVEQTQNFDVSNTAFSSAAKKAVSVITSDVNSVNSANDVTNLLVGSPAEGITLALGAEDTNLNKLDGTRGSDTLTVTGGNDWYWFNPGGGNDVITGVDGSTLSYSDLPWGVTVDLSAGTTRGHNKSDTFTGIESVVGTDFNDTIRGGHSSSDDYESFTGRAGNDHMDGGSGWDVLSYHQEDGGSGIAVNFQAGQATDTYGDKDTFAAMEVVSATAYADSLVGTDVADGYVQFRGLAGNDTLQGGQGYEVADYRRDYRYENKDGVKGENGINANLAAGTITDGYGDTDTVSMIDEIRATPYNDTLVGSDASYKEEFRGEAGNDTMTGGGGVDYFNFGSGDGQDVITDFTVGVDKLEFRTIKSVADVVITPGDNQTVVTYGNGGQITLNGVQGLTDSDFVFV